MDDNSTIDEFIFSTAFGRAGIVFRHQPFHLVEIRLPLPDVVGVNIVVGANNYSPLHAPDQQKNDRT